jgi:hypothetical protein
LHFDVECAVLKLLLEAVLAREAGFSIDCLAKVVRPERYWSEIGRIEHGDASR